MQLGRYDFDFSEGVCMLRFGAGFVCSTRGMPWAEDIILEVLDEARRSYRST